MNAFTVIELIIVLFLVALVVGLGAMAYHTIKAGVIFALVVVAVVCVACVLLRRKS